MLMTPTELRAASESKFQAHENGLIPYIEEALERTVYNGGALTVAVRGPAVSYDAFQRAVLHFSARQWELTRDPWFYTLTPIELNPKGFWAMLFS